MNNPALTPKRLQNNLEASYLKCCCDVGKVCDASPNNQNLSCKKKMIISDCKKREKTCTQERLRATLPTVLVFLSGHQRQDGLGVVVGLLLARSSRVLAVIGQLVDATQVADRVTAREPVLVLECSSTFPCMLHVHLMFQKDDFVPLQELREFSFCILSY